MDSGKESVCNGIDLFRGDLAQSLRQSLAETDGGKGTVTACSAPAESADGIHGILSCVMDSDIRVDE